MNTTQLLAHSEVLYQYLSQGERWIPSTGRPVPVAGMEPDWRFNAARFLLRYARQYAVYFTYGQVAAIYGATAVDVHGNTISLAPTIGSAAADALDEALAGEQAQRTADPVGWLRTTVLYRALVAGLDGEPDPDGPAKGWGSAGRRRAVAS